MYYHRQPTIEAITRAKEAGLEIVKVIALIDRQEGGRENIEASGHKVDSLILRDEVTALTGRKSKAIRVPQYQSTIRIISAFI